MTRKPVPENVVRLTNRVLDAAFALHTEVGPGCLERVYEVALTRDLKDMGLRVERQRPIPFEYHGERMEVAFRADLIVEDALIVEIKAVTQLLAVHQSQVRTYLRLSGLPVGVLLCFGSQHLRDGYDRLVHPDYTFLPPSRIPSAAGATGDAGPREQAPQGTRPPSYASSVVKPG